MAFRSILKQALKSATPLLVFTLAGTAALAYIYAITLNPIAKSEAEARMALFAQILPSAQFDNDILKDTRTIAPNALLGNRSASVVNLVKAQHKTVGVILEAIAHDGYSGDIKLLIGIRADGSLSGVRVLAHKETPGLGDYIDIAHDQWITHFNEESLTKTPEAQWRVKKDGGKFDYMAGATITPRAVVQAVHKALQFFEAEKTLLLAETVNKSQPEVHHE